MRFEATVHVIPFNWAVNSTLVHFEVKVTSLVN